MKLPLSWLRAFVELQDTPERIAETLVRLGHEVEAVECPRADLERVRIGRILTMAPHPNADRLQLLRVDIGEDEPLGIVCGARNMKVGDKVPVATVGARLPGGMVIRKGKIRGETSCGMCCSEKELQLADDAEGLMILPQDAPVGVAMGEYLGLETAIFDLSITPNRGDCMSVYGLARELAADRDLPLRSLPECAVDADTSVAPPLVDMDAAEAAPCYLARTIRGVRVGAAPDWVQARLRAAGQRSVNGVVDLLNLLMLETGQPMHAFDAARVSGGITVRMATAGEQLEALDGHRYTLDGEDLVIADEHGVLALAGIIGSQASGVSETTTDIVLESAFFRPAGISRSRRRLGVVSEASMRFERGVDPALVASTLERATAMIIEQFGGTAGPVRVCGDVDTLLAPRRLSFPLAAMTSRLGMEIDETPDGVLRRMGFSVTRRDGMLEVTVPPFRHDVTIAEDMSEEYARIVGYDAVPFAMPMQQAQTLPVRDDVLRGAVEAGFTQVINYAFVSAEAQRLFHADGGCDVVLANPISESMAVMRRSLLPGLLRSAQHNLNRQQPGVALVEHGRGYLREGGAYREPALLAWLLAGAVEPDAWYGRGRGAEFRDIKGALEQWLRRHGCSARFVADDELCGLQPGQSARVFVGRACVGVLGRVRPAVAEAFQLDTPVFVAEICLDLLPERDRRVRFSPLPEFPSITRDLVMAYPRSVSAAEIVQAAVRAGGKTLCAERILEHFEGEGVPEGCVSLGVRCTLQDAGRTLTQEEADRVMAQVAASLKKRFGAVQR